MSDPRDDRSEPLGDLFDNLPTAASSLPEREQREAPAPGSRRALREAAAREAAERGAQDREALVSDAGPLFASAPRPGSPRDDSAAADPAPAPAADAAIPGVAAAHAASTSAPAPEPAGSASEGDSDDDSLDALFAADGAREVPRKRKGKGCLIGLIIVLAVLGGIAAGGAWVYNTYQTKIDDIMGWGEPKDWEPGQATGEALVTIKKGDTGSPVSTALYEAKVTKTDRVFYQYLVDNNVKFTLYPGVYKLQQKMTAEAALKALDDPKNRMANTVRIAEGSTVDSSLERIAEGVEIPLKDLQAAVKNPAAYGVKAENLDGWLVPAVYTFDPGVTAKEAVQAMVNRTREVLKENGIADADAQRVLTIASIIEREARTPDFAKVSRVIENRLAIDMKLQMDSTAQYGYGELHAGKASTSKEAQFDDNPWNTYVITGLPKTPISNPGEAAIKAAENPADGKWLYFVTVDFKTGETQFSETYEEHQRGRAKLDDWCRANPDYKGC